MSSIFPYLPEMIENFGVPKFEIAKWAGMTSAIFSLCQSLTGVFWGRLSDWIGRKPVVLTCLFNTMVMSLLWGFSTNLPMAIVARALSGAGNGNVGILRTIVAELCPYKELQPRAFSIMPLVWTLGSIIGPAMGGALSNPLHVEPNKPRGNSFFERYPYALPNIVAAGIFTVGIIIGILFLRETLETRKDQRDYGLILGRKIESSIKWQLRRLRKRFRVTTDPETDPLLKSQHDTDRPHSRANDQEAAVRRRKGQQKRPGYAEVLTKQAILNLAVYTLLALHSIGYDQVLPVFMHHPPQANNDPSVHLPFVFAGGFGINSTRIGIFFTVYGITSIACQFIIFPPLASRLGPLRSLRLAMSMLPAVYFSTPFTSLLPASPNLQQPALLILMILKGACTVICFPSSTILLTNSASSLLVLGTLNGFATSVSAIGRAAGPGLGGALFTSGVRIGVVGLPFWAFAAFAGLSLVPLMFLVEGAGFGDDPEEESPDQREAVIESGNANDDETEDDDAFTPLLSRAATTRQSVSSQRSSEARMSVSLTYGSPKSSRRPSTVYSGPDAGDEEDALEASSSESDAEVTSQEGSHEGGQRGPPRPRPSRKCSAPIGMGSGFRRLSSNLGSSRSGFGPGPGGTAWGG